MFVRQWMGLPPEKDEETLMLEQLADEYLQRTEEYDRKVCTGPVRPDGVMPANAQEFSLINRHAQSVLREMHARLATVRLPAREWRKVLARRREFRK